MTRASELPVTWSKSSYSTNNGGDCVEVASLPSIVPVRDSKNPDGPALMFPAHAWNAFVTGVKNGDLPTV